MKHLIVLILTGFLITGCAGKTYPEPAKVPDTLNVPVAETCPSITNASEMDLRSPETPLNKINEGDNTETVVRAYVETVEILDTHN